MELVGGLCGSFDSREKFAAFHAFEVESRSACVHRLSTILAPDDELEKCQRETWDFSPIQ
jgi:hypothetical protein